MYKVEGPEDGGQAPNGPNFLLVVLLSCVAALVIFVLALAVTGHMGRLIHPLHPDRHPTSQLAVGRSSVSLG